MSKMNEEKTDLKEQVDKKQFHMPRILIVYDMLVYLIAAVLLDVYKRQCVKRRRQTGRAG